MLTKDISSANTLDWRLAFSHTHERCSKTLDLTLPLSMFQK